MPITDAEALQMVDAAIGKANELGVKVGISIVDETGQLIATIRMSGSSFQWLPEAAQGKAMATIFWRGEPSGTLVERAGHPLFQWLNNNYGGKLVYAKGAVAIRRAGEIVGAIGASGASPNQDEEIAQAGADALRG